VANVITVGARMAYEAAVKAAAAARKLVEPAKHCSPRHRMPHWGGASSAFVKSAHFQLFKLECQTTAFQV